MREPGRTKRNFLESTYNRITRLIYFDECPLMMHMKVTRIKILCYCHRVFFGISRKKSSRIELKKLLTGLINLQSCISCGNIHTYEIKVNTFRINDTYIFSLFPWTELIKSLLRFVSLDVKCDAFQIITRIWTTR